MAYSFPSANNTYVPAFDTTGNLIVDFSRNLKDFKVNQYITLTPVKKAVGYYLRLATDDNMRLLGTDGDSFVWPDGADAPFGEFNQRGFEFDTYTAQRYMFSNFLGYEMKEQADFDIQTAFTEQLGQQCMTLRTKLVDSLLTTAGTYDSTHVATATALGGGLWSAGTIALPYIQKSVMAATDIIMQDTGGAVKYTDLSLLINPTTANAMARSAEIRDFIAQSPAAMDQVRGNTPNQNMQWGLPEMLYGLNVIVEQSVYTASPYGSNTKTKSFTMPNNYAVILAKSSKDLVGVQSKSSFSTVNIFSKTEMNAETWDDVQNHRELIRVIDYYAVEAVAPVSGFLITNVTS